MVFDRYVPDEEVMANSMLDRSESTTEIEYILDELDLEDARDYQD